MCVDEGLQPPQGGEGGTVQSSPVITLERRKYLKTFITESVEFVNILLVSLDRITENIRRLLLYITSG